MEKLKEERYFRLAYSRAFRLALKESSAEVLTQNSIGKEKAKPHFPFAVPHSERKRHLYISGKPGTGKSTLIQNLVIQDIIRGTGCCLIDPHGDLVDEILASIPPWATNKVVVFDPSLTRRPIGLNLLTAKNEREQDSVVQFFLHLFETLYLQEHQGPMFFQAIRNGLLLLMEAGGSLVELPLSFSTGNLRRRVWQNAKNRL